MAGKLGGIGVLAVGVAYVAFQSSLAEMATQQQSENIAAIPEPKTLTSQYYNSNSSFASNA